MKRIILSFSLSVVLIASVIALPVHAVDTVPEEDFQYGVYTEDTKQAQQDSAVTITKKEYPCYLFDMSNSIDLPLYFINGVEDLPYIELIDLAELMASMHGTPDYSLTLEEDDYLAMLTRENGYSMLIDFLDGTIAFDDYDSFIHKPYETSLLDFVGINETDEDGNPLLIERINKGSFDRYGKELDISLTDYDISIYYDEEQELYLVPLHTMSDLLVALSFNSYLLFNGKAVYAAYNECLFETQSTWTPMGESYFSGEKEEMSEELAWFNYCELCLALDHLYGLKESHNITSFDKMFFDTGYREDLRSTDPNIADGALCDFINYYLDDLHSDFLSPSYRTEEMLLFGGQGLSSLLDMDTSQIYFSARNSADHPIPTYEEIGNTAYITFDSFASHMGPPSDYYTGDVDIPTDPEQQPLDTIALIIYAHEQICREDSPVENVVIDLSLNAGGEFNAAAYAAAWLLGSAAISAHSSLTGAISTGTYLADVNLDGVFDEQDTISDKNLFCLIGPYSFSCANLLPNMLQSSRKVTLLGKTSGGGSCSVLSLASASGCLFKISSPYHMSFVKNGSYYDTDTGIDPDCIIVKPENFYDRTALTEFINQLF